MYVCLCLHVEWSIIRLSPEMAYSRGSRYEHRARLALPIELSTVYIFLYQ